MIFAGLRPYNIPLKTMNFRRRGFTLTELIITLTIIAILAASVLPLAKNTVKREKEIELARCLRQCPEPHKSSCIRGIATPRRHPA